MKILVVKTGPGELKVDKITYNHQEIGLAMALRSLGHECDVMCLSDDRKYKVNQVSMDEFSLTLYCVKGFVILKNAWLQNVDQILQQYDIIHASEYNLMYSRYLAKKYPLKTVIYHGPFYCSFNKRYNLMARFFDLFFVGRYKKLGTPFITKSHLAEQYLQSKGIKNVNAIGVGLGTSFMKKNDEEECLPFFSRLQSIEGPKLLYIGTLEERRNSLFLLDILKDLKYRLKTINLVIVGKAKSKKFELLFWEKVKALSLDECIVYVPSIEQKSISQIYAVCDIFLLPSRYDIYGMVLLEAMFFGLPVISTITGGTDMMIKDGVNGFVISEFEVDFWTKQILKLLTSKDFMNFVGNNAHETIVNHFTWEKLAPKFIEIYETVR